MDVTILAYHKICDRFDWSITNVPKRAFEAQVNFLAKNNYSSISLDQYVSGKSDYPTGRIPIIITFDDADESVYHHALPILRQYGFIATVFVISDFVGKKSSWDYNFGNRLSPHLTWEQLTELSKAGWEIGSHTATHQDLTHLSDEHVMQELAQSKDVIAKQLNFPVQLLSYPFNRVDARIISLTKQAGYSAACALSAPRKLGNTYGNYCIPRYGVYRIDAMKTFRLKLMNSPVEQLKQKLISLASRGTIWYKRWKN